MRTSLVFYSYFIFGRALSAFNWYGAAVEREAECFLKTREPALTLAMEYLAGVPILPA
jgi:hypothetical protein